VSMVVTHLAHTHFFVEPFALAMNRCIMPSHPVHKMLKEHLRFNISINTLGREILTAPKGSADQSLTIGHGSDGLKELLVKAYKRMTFNDLNYPEDLKSRDMMDLPGYHHRDDSIRLWNVFIEYVRDMVDTYYSSDTDVEEDWELQDWVGEVFEHGFSKMSGLVAPAMDLPKELTNKEELVMYLQKLIYTDTVRHTFANFYIFQYGRFSPNSPTVLNGRIPTVKGKATEASILETLPTKRQTLIACATAKVLGSFSEHDHFLMNMDQVWMFGEEPEAKLVFNKFRKQLEQVEEEINERNKGLEVPYGVLRPSWIPTGISI